MFPIHSILSTLSTLGSLSVSLPFIFYCNSICVVPHAFAPPTVERVGYVTPFASCIRYSRTAVQRASDERVWCVRARVYVLTRARPFITWSFVFSFSLPPFLLAQSIASQCSGNAQHNVWSFSLCKSTIFSLLKYGNVAMYDVRCIAWHCTTLSRSIAASFSLSGVGSYWTNRIIVMCMWQTGALYEAHSLNICTSRRKMVHL